MLPAGIQDCDDFPGFVSTERMLLKRAIRFKLYSHACIRGKTRPREAEGASDHDHGQNGNDKAGNQFSFHGQPPNLGKLYKGKTRALMFAYSVSQPNTDRGNKQKTPVDRYRIG